MPRIVSVPGSMYTIARRDFGYAVGTCKLSICSAIGLVADGIVAFLHLAPLNAFLTAEILRDVEAQMRDYRQLASIPGSPQIKRVYALQGGSEAFPQILRSAQSIARAQFESLPADSFTYSPTFRGFTLDPATEQVSCPPETNFAGPVHRRVVSLSDPRYGVLQALYDEGLLR